MANTPSLDVITGCLLGGALGDALGYPIEFLSASQIGQTADGPPAQLTRAKSGQALFSDDTQMTLFTAEGWLRGRNSRDPLPAIAKALLDWFATQLSDGEPEAGAAGLVAERELHSRRAPGNTCMSALGHLARNPSALPTVHAPPNDSKGCGAVMRVAPLGLAAPSRDVAFALARDSGVLTHGHPSGYLSAACFAALIWGVARGESLSVALDAANPLLARERDHDELTEIVTRARLIAERGPPGLTAIESLGGGWVGEEALAIALLCALTCETTHPHGIERALWRAAAHSGDSDSTASIAGNLLGAQLGAARLPPAWLAHLELRALIERIAAELHAAVNLLQGSPGT
jgi:ADP-ribosylglycohydrolase